MNKKKITFDLDNVIFDMKPLYQIAFQRAGIPYEKPTSWTIQECYCPAVVDNLLELFGDDLLYTMPVLDSGIPAILNNLMSRPDLDVLFVTERKYKQPQKTFAQLRNAGISCTFDQVYDKSGLKSDILQDIRPDMHFDDSPLVISGCLKRQVPITMISNNNTLYNHHLRPKVPHYNCLRRALAAYGLYAPNINHR